MSIVYLQASGFKIHPIRMSMNIPTDSVLGLFPADWASIFVHPLAVNGTDINSRHDELAGLWGDGGRVERHLHLRVNQFAKDCVMTYFNDHKDVEKFLIVWRCEKVAFVDPIWLIRILPDGEPGG
ncbi:hypothetical protein M422DRAFT_256409 [Sphaerobolus stellatus SS14]|uniref:Uncharacterized protein n=1 Tax=Sphaerobolus stellatus (strain SS14) TaxID=990650 RepID=A0A0C9VRT6_SPHS4|nr:hypothetical protein M422DRAFT_256405 [Sphaerobolus stellatus SS14]KIJ40713.1 hypothetical protein M422DRAFT_256409 [Sphaerobolus stellatus SS14]